MSEWSVYLIRCADGSIYTGIATDVERRFEEHQGGRKGAKYLRGRAPLSLFFQQAVGDRSQACRIERFIKRLPKSEKEDRASLPRRIVQALQEN